MKKITEKDVMDGTYTRMKKKTIHEYKILVWKPK
jgi:hypothetical protein